MEQLGIDPKLLLAQIVNFLVIVFVLTKLLYKPILTSMAKRRSEIQKGLDLTEKMQKEEAELERSKAAIIEKAHKDASKVVDEAKEKAHEVEKVILAEAREEAKRIVEKGKTDVTALHASMEKSVEREAVALAEAMTAKLVSSVLSEKEQRALIANALKELEKSSVGSRP